MSVGNNMAKSGQYVPDDSPAGMVRADAGGSLKSKTRLSAAIAYQ